MLQTLQRKGIQRLFSHQAEAIDLVTSGAPCSASSWPQLLPSRLPACTGQSSLYLLGTDRTQQLPSNLVMPGTCRLVELTLLNVAGQHVVVCTSTASGKSLCYALPIIEALVQDPSACALLMFPTKALAQDQLRALRELLHGALGPSAPAVDVYDGDTPRVRTRSLR